MREFPLVVLSYLRKMHVNEFRILNFSSKATEEIALIERKATVSEAESYWGQASSSD
jgi:hypothetical protein